MSVKDETIAGLSEALADINGSDFENSCYCLIVTGNSMCHSDSAFSFDLDERDPDAIRRFIGAIEQVKAHALRALLDGDDDE